MNWPFDPLTPFCADLIVADPPWLVEMRSENGETKAPQAHYSCLPIEAIKRFPVGQLAGSDCWLHLWTVAPLLDRAFDVMNAWGFTYVSRYSWLKTTINGKRRIGPGYIVRTFHEDVLIGRIGNPRREKPMPSVFEGLAREHSRKPDEFYALVEQFAPMARRVDLFARQSRTGWATWGNEATKFDGEAA